MDTLYAPWRSEYTSDTQAEKNERARSENCVFCTQIQSNQDEQHGIVYRTNNSIVILNKYPYNAGHVLIIPIKHVASLDELCAQERADLMEMLHVTIDRIQKALHPDGINVGINLGKAAGAGIPSHLHIHILPRWNGDTNFMPTIGQTKVISFDLNTIYQKLVSIFK